MMSTSPTTGSIWCYKYIEDYRTTDVYKDPTFRLCGLARNHVTNSFSTPITVCVQQTPIDIIFIADLSYVLMVDQLAEIQDKLAAINNPILKISSGMYKLRSTEKTRLYEGIKIKTYWTKSLDLNASNYRKTKKIVTIGKTRHEEFERLMEIKYPFLCHMKNMTQNNDFIFVGHQSFTIKNVDCITIAQENVKIQHTIHILMKEYQGYSLEYSIITMDKDYRIVGDTIVVKKKCITLQEVSKHLKNRVYDIILIWDVIELFNSLNEELEKMNLAHILCKTIKKLDLKLDISQLQHISPVLLMDLNTCYKESLEIKEKNELKDWCIQKTIQTQFFLDIILSTRYDKKNYQELCWPQYKKKDLLQLFTIRCDGLDRIKKLIAYDKLDEKQKELSPLKRKDRKEEIQDTETTEEKYYYTCQLCGKKNYIKKAVLEQYCIPTLNRCNFCRKNGTNNSQIICEEIKEQYDKFSKKKKIETSFVLEKTFGMESALNQSKPSTRWNIITAQNYGSTLKKYQNIIEICKK